MWQAPQAKNILSGCAHCSSGIRLTLRFGRYIGVPLGCGITEHSALRRRVRPLKDRSPPDASGNHHPRSFAGLDRRTQCPNRFPDISRWFRPRLRRGDDRRGACRIDLEIAGQEGRRLRARRHRARPLRSARQVRQGRDRHPRRSARAGAHPPRCRACAGRSRAGAVAGNAGDDRPGHRERLLLRFRPQRAVHAGRFPGDREEDARDHRAQQALHQGGLGRATGPRRCFATRARPTRSS